MKGRGNGAMKIRSRWLTWAASGIAVGLGQILLMTCRKVYISSEERSRFNYRSQPGDKERYVLCVWHDALLVPTFVATRRLRRFTCCLVSQHQDGSYLANAMALLGYSTVRGSSRRGATQAVRQLLADTDGKHIVITPDGPGGPRRQLKAGAVYVASQLGRRLLPGAFAATRAWRWQGSWTDMLIPKPFCTVYVATGEPIPIPADLSKDQLQHYMKLAQEKIDELNDQVERIAKGDLQLAAATPSKRSAA